MIKMENPHGNTFFVFLSGELSSNSQSKGIAAHGHSIRIFVPCEQKHTIAVQCGAPKHPPAISWFVSP